mgnify:CR=1 FL=1
MDRNNKRRSAYQKSPRLSSVSLLSEIDEIILVGGSTRIPLAEKKVKEDKSKIALLMQQSKAEPKMT